MQSITLDVDLDIRETTLQARGRFAAHGQRLEAVAGLSADTTFSLARKDPEPMCHTAFAKFGGTMFRLGELIIDNPDGRFVPMSTLNELRRSLADSAATALERARAERIDSIASKTAVNCSGIDEDWCVVVDKVSYLSELTTAELHGLSEVIVTCGNDAFSEDPFEVAEELGIVDRLRLALPAIVRNRERSTLTTRMQHGLDHGVRRWQVSNLYALELLEQMGDGLDIRGDWPLYATNRFSIDELLDWGLTGITASPEDSRGNLATLFAAYPGICVPVYQDTPLAMSEACLHAGQESCDTCGDRRGYREMPMQSDRDELLAVTRDCRTVVINDQPYALASKLSQLRDMGAKRFRMDFVWRRYTASRVAELFRQIMTGTLGECHCGNFERGSF